MLNKKIIEHHLAHIKSSSRGFLPVSKVIRDSKCLQKWRDSRGTFSQPVVMQKCLRVRIKY